MSMLEMLKRTNDFVPTAGLRPADFVAEPKAGLPLPREILDRCEEIYNGTIITPATDY